MHSMDEPFVQAILLSVAFCGAMKFVQDRLNQLADAYVSRSQKH